MAQCSDRCGHVWKMIGPCVAFFCPDEAVCTLHEASVGLKGQVNSTLLLPHGISPGRMEFSSPTA